MSKPTRGEMLFWIDRFRLFFSPYVNEQRVTGLSDQEADKAYEAIRSLIEKWFDVQERAAYELATVALGEESNGERILSVLRLLEEIRDFGLEVEEEKISGGDR